MRKAIVLLRMSAKTIVARSASSISPPGVASIVHRERKRFFADRDRKIGTGTSRHPLLGEFSTTRFGASPVFSQPLSFPLQQNLRPIRKPGKRSCATPIAGPFSKNTT
jgi:hypothetical protein